MKYTLRLFCFEPCFFSSLSFFFFFRSSHFVWSKMVLYVTSWKQWQEDRSQLEWGRHLFCRHLLDPLVPVNRRLTGNQYTVLLTDHLYPVMKHVHHDMSGLQNLKWLCPPPQGLGAHWMICWAWKRWKSYAVAFAVTNWKPFEDVGGRAVHLFMKTPNEGISLPETYTVNT